MQRFLIVGTGIAGLSAAEEIRRRDAGAQITLVGQESHPYYSRPGLAYVLSQEIPERQLIIRSDAELRELRLDRIDGTVVRLRAGAHEAELGDGRRLEYDRVLLATGAASAPPEFPGGELRGVVRLDCLDDARRIARLARSARVAVVVGGGSTALEIVDGLRALGLQTHYFMRGDRYWARVLDPAESDLVAHRLAQSGIALHYRTEIARAIGKRGKLVAVETQAGVELRCDLLAVAIGVRPRLELAVGTGLTVQRGILTDEFLQTSETDVFAAGDAAQVPDARTGESTLDTLWVSAVEMGRIAGGNMAGSRTEYRKRVAMNVTRIGGLPTTIVGMVGGVDADPDLLTITRGQSERWTTDTASWTLSDEHAGDRLRVVVGQRNVVGAVIMGDQTLSRSIARMIMDEVDVTQLRTILATRPRLAMPLFLDFVRRFERGEHAGVQAR